MTSTRPIGVDLFAGVGGMTLGFELAGFDVLAAVELDPVHCAAHEFNFPEWRVLCRSVADVTGKEIRQKSAIGDRDVDVVFGGPPCQGFSLMGKRELHDPRNTLLFEFVRVVRELDAKYFVLENVRGMTAGQHRQYLERVLAAFEDSGYDIERQYRVLNAANYGVPQGRQRLFLMGCRRGLKRPSYPPSTTQPARPECPSPRTGGPLSPTVREAIADLPDADAFLALLETDEVLAEFGKPSPYGAMLRGLHPPNDWFGYDRSFNPRLLTGSIRTQHSAETQRRFASTPPGTREAVSRFFKLHPEGISTTLRAGTSRTRGAHTSPRPIHYAYNRCITVREAARLHSYPDWFRFHSTKWHGFRQIGNSVPPLLAKAVAQQVLNAMGGRPVKPRHAMPAGNKELLTRRLNQYAAYYGVSDRVIPPRATARS
ncbi:MAG: DNA cytosine methyltransferase [Cyanobacteria bacterium J06639_1]